MIRGAILIIFLLIFLLPNGSAITITEVEINPYDTCNDCTEWAEIYSEEEVNLSEYSIENNKSNIINLSGIKQGYILIEFGKRFLTNTGDKLVLKKDGQVIDETPILKDAYNNGLTQQLCDGSWELLNSTKEEENICPSETQPPSEVNEIENDTEINEVEENETETTTNNYERATSTKATSNNYEKLNDKTETETTKLSPIILNTKNIKSEDNKEILKRNFSFYGLITICFIFGALLLLKNRKRKNEFN